MIPTDIHAATVTVEENKGTKTRTYRCARFNLGEVLWQSPQPFDEAHAEKINATLAVLLAPFAASFTR